ncbi:hypothetical protein PGTUg99_004558 [Puccinia graminis f. sp. tritici]|uniref:Uncharacterized protein n=1 Tax=Puccinia graminis f. sp. tritici TaxID=56615 RepID=A0A5B0RAU2_PUCGR|nr:hypothetical protein PGTUg99_004558 [Puccinia graminis f. sp. tritici]
MHPIEFEYSTIGPDPFLHCTWCRPPSSKANGADHPYFGLSRLGLQYASLLLTIGLMTTGASQLRMKRRIWRTRLALLSIFYLIFEAPVLSILVFIPRNATSRYVKKLGPVLRNSIKHALSCRNIAQLKKFLKSRLPGFAI